MSEHLLKKSSAINIRNKYIDYIEKYMGKIRKNFDEMDIENSKTRDDLEDELILFEEYAKDIVDKLEALNFY
mgnify:FL=1